MNPKSSSERLAETMERTRQRWHALRATEATTGTTAVRASPAFTIALSREAGTNASLVAQLLGERSGWAVYDRELLERVAEEMGLRASLLESVDERHKSWLQECFEAFASTSAVSKSAYVRHLVETLLALAVHGECVIVGRGAAQVLPMATTLRVRLVGPMEARIETICQRFRMSHEEATQWVEQIDRERVQFVQDHFQKDPTDPRRYDLVLNTSRFSAMACAELILEALHRLQAPAPAKHPGLTTAC
jgi:cytidylate kinase